MTLAHLSLLRSDQYFDLYQALPIPESDVSRMVQCGRKLLIQGSETAPVLSATRELCLSESLPFGVDRAQQPDDKYANTQG